MFLSSKNNLLYDAKNFEKYPNMYAIMLNNLKKNQIDESIANMDDDMHVKYIASQRILEFYFMWEQISGFENMYKIIFGHYYNEQNVFLYKGTLKKKDDIIIKTDVRRCKRDELIRNKFDTLITASSYDVIQKQLNIIALDKEYEIKSQYVYPLGITYKDETLNIQSNGKFSTQFENGNLILIK